MRNRFAAALLLATALTACSSAHDTKTTDKTPPATLEAQGNSGDYTLDKDHASITFQILHMGYSHYTGRFNIITADLHFDEQNVSNSTLKATVAVSSVDTHNSTLEGELISKDWFNAGQFPTATFVSKKIEKTGATTGRIMGELTLMGVTKPVILDVQFNKGGPDAIMHKQRIGFSAKTVLTRSDFGLNKYVPIVGDAVALDIEAEFTPKE